MCADASCSWSYDAPEQWDVCDATCTSSKYQSPINLGGESLAVHTTNDVATNGIQIPSSYSFGNNSAQAPYFQNKDNHLQLIFPVAINVSVGLDTYAINVIHFHTRSEHTIGNIDLDLEVQMNDDTKKVIISSLYIAGSTSSPFLKQFTPDDVVPSITSTNPVPFTSRMALDGHTGRDSYYEYQGSMTFPPCTTNYRWLIFKGALSATSSEISAIQTVMSAGARRPTQVNTGLLKLHCWDNCASVANLRSPTAAIASTTVLSAIFLAVVFFNIWKRKKGYVSAEFAK